MRNSLPGEGSAKILNTITGMVGQFIMPLGMVCDHLLWSLLITGKPKIHFGGGGTHRMDSVTSNDRVIIKMMVSIGDLQFNVGSEPQ
jgi:hypothetical protein